MEQSESSRHLPNSSAGVQSEGEHEEILQVARELWRLRGSGKAGSADDDWFRAMEIVRARRQEKASELGNSTTQAESTLLGTSKVRTADDFRSKEHMERMEKPMTGSGQESMSDSLSSSFDNTVNSVKDRVSGMQDKVSGMMDREPKSMPRPEHREGPVARSIEQQTAKIPSDAWLWAAIGSIGLSLALELSGREKTANFVGHWAPTLLILGLYNKLVKLQGSDGL